MIILALLCVLLRLSRMQAGLVYRAVKLHVRLHNWQRALDVAVKHKQHLDTVLMYRQR
jgi:intraflagellar transport protein 80